MRQFICLMAGLVLIMALLPGKDPLTMQRAMYCEMVQTWKDTNGRHGWPDYKGTAVRECK